MEWSEIMMILKMQTKKLETFQNANEQIFMLGLIYSGPYLVFNSFRERDGHENLTSNNG